MAGSSIERDPVMVSYPCVPSSNHHHQLTLLGFFFVRTCVVYLFIAWLNAAIGFPRSPGTTNLSIWYFFCFFCFFGKHRTNHGRRLKTSSDLRFYRSRSRQHICPRVKGVRSHCTYKPTRRADSNNATTWRCAAIHFLPLILL